MGVGKLSVLITGSADGFTRAVDEAIASNKKLSQSVGNNRLLKAAGVDSLQMRQDIGATAAEALRSRRDAAALGASGSRSSAYSDFMNNAKAGDNATSGMASGFTNAEKGALRVAGAIQAARLGIDAANIATELWNGDITKAAELTKQLPLGIGGLAKSLETLLGNWTGINAEIEKNKATADALGKSYDLVGKSMGRIKDYQEDAAKRRRANIESVALGGLSGAEKDKAEINIKYRDMAEAEKDAAKQASEDVTKNITELDRQARELRGKGGNDATIQASIRQLEKRRANIQKESNDNLLSLAYGNQEELKRVEQEAAKQLAEANQKKAEEEKKTQEDAQQKALEHSNAIARINAEMSAQRLRMNGQTLEAEMVQIEESYRERIQAAQKAGDAEMVALLEQAKTLDQKDAFAKGISNAGQASASQIRTAYTAFGSINNKSKIPIEGDPKQTALFTQMLDAIRKGQTARAA